MIVRNRLLNFGDNIIYQDDSCFLFSLDSLLLANFVTIKLTDKKIIDFCTGNAPIPMFLYFKTKANIYGVELQKDIYDLGVKSIVENKMDGQINLSCFDVKKIRNYFPSESMDIVTCNPPYFKYNDDGMVNENEKKLIARHEKTIKLEDVIDSSKYILKNGGTLALVHRPSRLVEIIDTMRKYSIEPKKLQFVYPKMGKEANILLIEGVKNGKPGLKILPPMIVYNENGEYVEEIRQMFGGNLNVAEKL